MRNKLLCRRFILRRALMTLLFITASFQWTMSQITLSTSNSTLGTVIKQIQQQSGYQFFYNDKLSTSQVAPIQVKDAPLETVLKNLLEGTNITFKVEDKIVFLSENSTQSPTQQPNREHIVTGTVIDANNEPLIGVSVHVVGTTDGGITDFNGQYKLTTSQSNPVLQFSYIGYKSENVTVSGRNTINLTMYENTQLIDEVVVTALGIKRSQKALSYNAQEVKSDDLTRVKDTNFINALSGKVAGVTINSSSSGVGGASKVVMRGAKSIDQSNNAMYVIDGVPMFNSGDEGSTEFGSSGTTEAIADINPEDIESLTVLNGAAASALYGSNAANGVIMITTKKGKAGKASITFTQNTEFLNVFVLPKFQNSYGTGTGGANNTSTDLSWGAKLNSANYMGYNPKSDYFKTGVVATETITFSTGTDKNQTYASAGTVNSSGYIPNNTYDRLNFSIRNTTSLLNDKMTIDLGASYIKQKDNNMTNQGVYQNPLVSAYLFPRGGDWNDVKMYEEWDSSRKIYTQRWNYGLTEFTGQNPYWINYRNLRRNTKDRYMLNASLGYDVMDWLNISGRVRTDFTSSKYTERLYATTNTTLTEGSLNGFYAERAARDRQIYADIMANINKALTEELNLTANLGASLSDVFQDYIQTRGPLMETAVPNVFNVMQINREKLVPYQDKLHDQTQSVFASAELGYKNAYYLTLTGRFDWPSQLAGEHSSKSGFFYPSVGTSFILSEIFNLPEQIQYLKARASFASVGLPFARNLAQRYHAWDESSLGYNPNYEHYPIAFLDPQKTNSWELGITSRFLKGFRLDVSLYHAKTYNQVFNSGLSATSGYENYYVQSGSVTNKGIELSFGYSKSWKEFNWSSTYTFTTNKNKINELASNWVNPATGELFPLKTLTIKALGDTRFILKKGGTLGDLYSLSDLQRDSNDKIYVDAKGNVSKISVAGNPIKLGSVLPKANMSWRNDFEWKSFNLGVMFSARLGGIVYSATQAILDSQGVSEASATARENGGILVNGTDWIDAQSWYRTIGSSSNIAQYYTYSATNVRLQELSLGYTFPRKMLWGMADLTVSLMGRNLLMIYNKAPFDPESVATTGNNYQGIDYFMMPSTRNMGFNIKLRF